MSLKLPDSVTSPQDLKALTLEVKQYASWFSHATIKNQVGAKGEADKLVLTETAIDFIKECLGKESPNQAKIDQIILALEEFQDSASCLTITLAAAPSSGLKKTLVAWCRQNIAPDILVTFQFNSTLLGGMVLRYGSRVFDWSFRRQILANTSQFTEVLRNV